MDERTLGRMEHNIERLDELIEYVDELVLELDLLAEDRTELAHLISVFNITLWKAIDRKKEKESKQ